MPRPRGSIRIEALPSDCPLYEAAARVARATAILLRVAERLDAERLDAERRNPSSTNTPGDDEGGPSRQDLPPS